MFIIIKNKYLNKLIKKVLKYNKTEKCQMKPQNIVQIAANK